MHPQSLPPAIGGRQRLPRFNGWQSSPQRGTAKAQVMQRPKADEWLAWLVAPLLALAISLVTLTVVSELVTACGSIRLDDLVCAVAGT